MLLKLKNFKCWTEKEIEITLSNGIILISGKSGAGKSSLLQAIHFVLYGRGGTRIVKRGEKSCAVSLSLKNLEIKRTKRPNRLTLVKQGLTLEDDEAQAEIENEFGTDFETTSYIQQKALHSFLSMSPRDKLSFLERSCLQEFEKVKTRCSEGIKELRNSIDTVQHGINHTSKILSDLPVPEYVECKELSGKSLSTIDEYNRRIKIKIKNRKEYIDNEEETLSETQEKREEVEKALTRDAIHKKRIHELEEELHNLPHYRNEGETKVKEWEKIREQWREWEKQDKLKQHFKKEKERITRERERLLQENEEKTLSYEKEVKDIKLPENEEELREKVFIYNQWTRLLKRFSLNEEKSCQELLRSVEEKIQTYQKKLESYQHKKKVKWCPSCNVALTLNKTGNLLLFQTTEKHTDDVPSLLVLEKKISTAQRLLDTHMNLKNELSPFLEKSIDPQSREQLELFKKGKKEKERVESVLVDLSREKKRLLTPSPLLTELQSSLKEVEKPSYSVEEVEKQLLHFREKEMKRKELQEKVSRLRQKKNEIESLLSGYTKRDLCKCKDELEESKKRLENYKKELHTFEEKFNLSTKYREYTRQKQMYDKWSQNLVDLKQNEKSMNNRYKYFLKMKTLIMEAESRTISSYIDTLNINVEKYLFSFFPDNCITVKITPYKQTHQKQIRHQINIEIEYKGTESDLSYLSGGEYDRVQLALVLAMSDISSSPLLLLDESISSLDEETCARVLKGIKEGEGTKRLTLIIAHQFITGNFDYVINV